MRSLAPLVVAVVIAGAAPARADERASAGGLDIRGPAAIAAGNREPVTITAASPSLVVNVGVLSAPERDGERWRYRYTPANTRHPHLVLIAGRDGDGADWLAIPVQGKASLDLRSEPDAEVVVEVGDQRFGPVRTNARGRARLEVTVPPGVDAARTIATDALGNVSHGRLPLSPPPFDRLVLLCPEDDDRALAVALAPTGTAGAVTVEAEVEPGAVAGIEPVEPGVYAIVVDTPDTAAAGDRLTASARIADDPVSGASCTAPIPTELPSGFRITVGDRWTAGDEPLEVVVEAMHTGHLPPRPVDVRLEADTGAIETLAVDGGRTRARWTLPERLDGRTSATIRAVAEPVPAQERTVALEPAPAVRIELAIPSLRADGRVWAIPVAVYDRFDNRVAAPVTATATDGRVEVAPGVVRYTPPWRPRGGTDRLRIRAGDVEETRAIALRAPPPRLELTVAAGYHSNLGKVEGADVGVRASRAVLVAGLELGVGLEVGYLRGRDRRGTAGVETAADLAPILARAWYTLPVGRTELRAGVAAGILAGRVEASSPGAGSRASGAFPAVAGFGSVAHPIGPGDLSAEAGWMYAPIDEDGITGNAGGLRILIGYRYRL